MNTNDKTQRVVVKTTFGWINEPAHLNLKGKFWFFLKISTIQGISPGIVVADSFFGFIFVSGIPQLLLKLTRFEANNPSVESSSVAEVSAILQQV
jgi:hypothetical protein